MPKAEIAPVFPCPMLRAETTMVVGLGVTIRLSAAKRNRVRVRVCIRLRRVFAKK